MDPAHRDRWDGSRKMGHQPFAAACYAPFVSMFFTTRGDVSVCCESQNFSLGNVRTQSLSEIWNGDRYRTLRGQLAAYELPDACAFCSWRIAAGDTHGVTARYFDHYQVTTTATIWPQVMEFALSNTCNLECIMCNGESSSLVRARREGLPPLPAAYGDRFFAELRPFLPHLRTAKFLGGEPFVSAESFRLWDLLIEDRLTPNCVVTTNGTRFDAKVERALERLPMSIMFSMDGATKATLESIRLNARFETLLEHARSFIDYTRSRGTMFRFLFTLMRQNWHELGEFLLLAESLGVAVNLSMVTWPRSCSLYALPTAELRAITARLSAQRDTIAAQLRINRDTWTSAIDHLVANARDPAVAAAAGQVEVLAAAARPTSPSLLQQARQLEAAGRLTEALALCQQVAPGDADSLPSLLLAAQLARTLGQNEVADSFLARAVPAAHGRPEFHVERAWLRRAQGRTDEGLAETGYARVAIRQRPDPQLEIVLCAIHGLLSADAHRYDDAKAAFARLFELEPGSARAFEWRGWAWFAAGVRAEAAADAREALQRAPGSGSATALLQAIVAAGPR